MEFMHLLPPHHGSRSRIRMMSIVLVHAGRAVLLQVSPSCTKLQTVQVPSKTSNLLPLVVPPGTFSTEKPLGKYCSSPLASTLWNSVSLLEFYWGVLSSAVCLVLTLSRGAGSCETRAGFTRENREFSNGNWLLRSLFSRREWLWRENKARTK